MQTLIRLQWSLTSGPTVCAIRLVPIGGIAIWEVLLYGPFSLNFRVFRAQLSLQCTVMTLSFWTKWSGQIVQTQIRLLLEEQFDQGLHYLQYCLHLLAALHEGKNLFFRMISAKFSGVRKFRNFTVSSHERSRPYIPLPPGHLYTVYLLQDDNLASLFYTPEKHTTKYMGLS